MNTNTTTCPKTIDRAAKALDIQALLTMGSILGFFIAGVIASLYEKTNASEIFTFSLVFFLAFSLILIVFGILPLVAAKAIRKQKRWGRNLALAIAILSCANFPGIIFGVIVLIGIFSRDASSWFPKKDESKN